MATESERNGTRSGRPSWLTPSVAVLLGANLFPLYGILFQGWETFPFVFLFWMENVIVGVFFILRLLTARPQDSAMWVGKLFLVPFFTVHYGIFTLVHGVFVFALFGARLRGGAVPPDFSAVIRAVTTFHMGWAVLALAVSHGFSFGWNYIGKGECRRVDVRSLMVQPYKRVVVLHLAILGGGFLMMALGSPAPGLVLLLLLKVGLDVVSHTREHGTTPAAEGEPADPPPAG